MPERQSDPAPAERKPKVPLCPHCGDALRAHNDSISALHCDSPRCIGCCFTLNQDDNPVLRPGYGICPAA